MVPSAIQQQQARAFELCKLQAAVDGAFPDELLQQWFEAAWDLCAEMVGLVYPAREITEPITLDPCGNFTLSFQPSSPVRIYDGYTLIMVLPPSLKRSRSWCESSLCCYCHLRATYMVGEDRCDLPPTFVQAVARLFTYMVENRGDTELDPQILGKCGALRFLSPGLTYVL